MSTKAYDWVAHYAGRRGEKPACVDVHSGISYSYRELEERACRLASHLVGALSMTVGDRIAILAHNSADYLAVQQACVKTGIVLLPLNWRLTASEIAFQVNNAQPRALIYSDSFSGTARSVAQSCGLQHLIEWDPNSNRSEFERAMQLGSPQFESVPVSLDDPCAIMYTSGTTGVPKGAILTHGMSFFNAVNYGIVNRFSADTVTLCCLPLFHTGGLNNCVNPTFHWGGTVVLCRHFDPALVLKLISDPALGITNLVGVPATFMLLSQHPDFDRSDLSRLVNAPVGGAPVPISMHRFWRSRGVALQEGYGLTEGGPAVLISEVDQPLEKAGAAGKPVLHAEVRLAGPDGEDIRIGDVGEIWIKGPAVTPGYWNNPEANAEAFVDGWFRTGDAAYRDVDGYYFIVDRLKDMYISGGENVYPAEIEMVLYNLPQVAEVAVCGVADERWGEVGCAAIVVRHGASLSEEQVLAHCGHKLARYKIPKTVCFVDTLPRNAMNKVLKSQLRAQLALSEFGRKRQ